MKSKILGASFLFVLLTSVFVYFNRIVKEEKYEKSDFLFGTYIKIIVYSKNKNIANKAIEKAFAEIKRIDKKFNSKSEGSLIYKINNSSDKTLKLDGESKELFEEIKKAYEISKTKYDITIVPLVELWGFSYKTQKDLKLPTTKEIEKIKEKVGFEKIVFEEEQIFLDENTEIDTGSFLKGYAISKARKIMQENGIKRAFISSISSLTTIGTKPENKEWKIGIQNPNDLGKLLGVINLVDKSMGVSGDYQTYVEIDGKKYHHILDKTTGYPVKDKKMVVVVTDDSFLADLYSTMFFLMPIEEVLDFVEKDRSIEVLIVDKDMNIVKSSNFKYEK